MNDGAAFFCDVECTMQDSGYCPKCLPKSPIFSVRSTILLLAWLGLRLAATDILDVSFNKYVIKQTVIHVILT